VSAAFAVPASWSSISASSASVDVANADVATGADRPMRLDAWFTIWPTVIEDRCNSPAAGCPAGRPPRQFGPFGGELAQDVQAAGVRVDLAGATSMSPVGSGSPPASTVATCTSRAPKSPTGRLLLAGEERNSLSSATAG